MKFSRKIDYGLILLKALQPTLGSRQYLSLNKIAKKFHLSLAYLEKLALILRRAKIIKAKKGLGGGYCLIINPKNLSLGKIIEILEDKKSLMRCLHSACNLRSKCPTKLYWRRVEKKIARILQDITLDQF